MSTIGDYGTVVIHKKTGQIGELIKPWLGPIILLKDIWSANYKLELLSDISRAGDLYFSDQPAGHPDNWIELGDV